MPRVSAPVHPGLALFRGEKPFPIIPSCDHYAGSEKLMLRALELQDSIGPVFDLTCDCEDGAPPSRFRSRRSGHFSASVRSWHCVAPATAAMPDKALVFDLR